jgi:aspartyl-tRNA(Asn)/glutamyl-tRNA(Gln) amidotransferase subunit B
VIDRILSENESQVEAYRGGKEGLLGFFVGQVMKAAPGADAAAVNQLLRDRLT